MDKQAYVILVYLTNRRAELKEDSALFEGTCSPESNYHDGRIAEVESAIDFIMTLEGSK
jgi:hypothetical protein